MRAGEWDRLCVQEPFVIERLSRIPTNQWKKLKSVLWPKHLFDYVMYEHEM